MNNSLNYFDNASTTSVDSRVFKVMLPYFSEIYGNSSSNHDFGKQARNAIELSRKQVAELIHSNESEIIFTSGATESINMALKGYIDSNYSKGNHIITVKTEHKAVLETCNYLEERGVEVTYLNVDKNGLISLDELNSAIRPDTLLICVMYVNNETGVIQPINKIGLEAREKGIAFFCDATQAVGKINIDVEKDYIDMLCFSAHKLNGPKGIGVLYKTKDIKLTPLIHGGGQENGLRAGTYNTPLIVGLGKACEISIQELDTNKDYISKLNYYLIQALKQIPGVVIIGSENFRSSNIIDVIIPRLNADIFISKDTGFTLSTGSACTSQIIESSHVLKAMGFSDNECNQTIRISINKEVTEFQINELINKLKAEINN
jgi:cysteine desulfurase